MADRGTKTVPTLRVGIVGGSESGFMTRVLGALPNVKVVAAAEMGGNALEVFEKATGGKSYASVEALCRSGDVDALYVGNPDHLQFARTMAGLEHGKHVLTMKPMAHTLEEADSLIQTAERKGVTLALNTELNFAAFTHKLRSIIQSGELGALRMINTWRFSEWLYSTRTPEELDPETSKGILLRQGTKQLDLVRTLGGGMVKSVRATVGIWDKSRPVIGSYSAFLEFEDGTAATAVFSGNDRFWTHEFNFGEHGGTWGVEREAYGAGRNAAPGTTVPVVERARSQAQQSGTGGVASGSGAAEPDHSFTWIPHCLTVLSCERGDVRVGAESLIIYDDKQRRELPVRRTDRPRTIATDFHEAIINERAPLYDGRWGRANLEVCLAIEESAQAGTDIALTRQVPMPDWADA